MSLLNRLRNLLTHTGPIAALEKNGLQIGVGVHIGPECFVDPSHCWLISIGDGATLGPRVMIFAHDASTKHHIGYTRIGRVVIGKNAFIGAGTIILPGVRIGNDSIIGAGSVVTRDIAAGSMAVGNPARVIGEVNVSTRKHRELLNNVPTYPAKGWTWDAGITDEKKRRMRDDLSARCGYVE